MRSGKIILAGGSGSIGNYLAKYFSEKNFEIIILSRSYAPAAGNIRFSKWDGETLGEWAGELDAAECVINLTGRSVNCRYTEKNKRQITESRVHSTQTIGKAIQNCVHPPKIWVNASSAAIYGDTADRIVDETAFWADGFSPDVCKKWEAAFAVAETPCTRKIVLRIGLVLSEKGGVLKPLINLAKFHLAGTVGSGKQYVSWIHETDFARLVEWCVTHENISGVINACTPHPVTNKEFMKSLRKAYGKPFGFPNPEIAVRIGAFFMGTEPELILKGRGVVSKILQEKNFTFIYPEINAAMKDIICKIKKQNAAH
jgi:uncharacterized protein (TIGR01777 family)